MTALPFTQLELLDRLRVNAARRQEISDAITQLVIENAALLAEDAELMARLQELCFSGTDTAGELMFDDDHRMVYWADGGKMKLGRKPYKFFKTLYEAEGQQMDMTDIETEVWGETRDTNLRNVASRLRKKFKKEVPNFPYTVVSVMCETQQSELEHNRLTTIRNAVSGFKLVRK